MTRKDATVRISWVGWIKGLLSRRKEKLRAARAETQKQLKLDNRPRFAEGLESRRMLLAAVAPINFAPAHFYNAIAGSLTTGTFVNGGLPDIVAVDGTDSVVRVLDNNGDGTFHGGQQFYVPSARAACVGDFNGDGNQDIAVLSTESTISGDENTIYIYYGNGNGTFQTPGKPIGIDYTGTDIVAADLTDNGLDDLILTVAKRVVVLVNKGDGKFYLPVPYNAGAQYSGRLVVGDFNGDGIPDIVITRTDSNEIAILLGQGSNGVGNGTFGAAELYHLGTNPQAVAVGDFTNNGIDDIAVANADFRKPAVEVLMGNGDGTFAKPLALYGGNFVDGIAVGDFNGDGNQDIATVSFTSFLRAYAGNGDGTFQPLREFDTSAYGQEIVAADFTGDGLDDVAIATGGGIRVLLAQKQTAPTSSPTSIDVTIGAGGPKSITYRDVAGYKTTISLTGPGSAIVDLTGANLSTNNTGTQVVGGTATIASIDATGTTSASTLFVTPATRNGRVNVGSISTDGSFASIVAPQVELNGDLTIPGTVGGLILDNASDGTISVGGTGRALNLSLRNALDENLDSTESINSLAVGQWYSDTGTPTTITAPGISHITSVSQFEANLTVGSGGLTSAYVRNIPQGTWTIAGAVGSIRASRDIQLTLTTPTINLLSAGNELNNDVINTTGSIGTIAAGSIVNSSIYAGVGPLPAGQRLPESLTDFTGEASIDSVMIRSRFKLVSFENSSLAAPTIGKVVAGVIAFDNGGQVQGIAAETVGSFSGADLVTKKLFALINPVTLTPLTNEGIDTADFVLTII